MNTSMEPNGGNFFRPHLLQIDSGTFWRCKHGNTGIEPLGCMKCGYELAEMLDAVLAENERLRKTPK